MTPAIETLELEAKRICCRMEQPGIKLAERKYNALLTALLSHEKAINALESLEKIKEL
jgi:hypothetical protein